MHTGKNSAPQTNRNAEAGRKDWQEMSKGMVVPAGSGARQFHVTRVLDGVPADYVIWLTGEIGFPPECEHCKSGRYMIAWDSLPAKDRRWHIKQYGAGIKGHVAICECNGEFIE
jgi:hypothetical protein